MKTLEIDYLKFVFNVFQVIIYPTNIYLFKANNRNTRKRCEICSKLTMEISERRQ